MVIVCGSVQDQLVSTILDLGKEQNLKIQYCSELELFGSTAFAIERDRQSVRGFLGIQGEKADFRDIQGIVLRLSRSWWPAQDFDLKDQMFVYHETVASWFSVFEAIRCPIVNRCGLGWWLQDLTYPVGLRASLGQALGLPVADGVEDDAAAGRIIPTVRDASQGLQSLYRSGGTTFPASNCSPDLLMHLSAHEPVLSSWEQETGVTLSRLDFEGGPTPRLRRVETQPLFIGESSDLVLQLAGALLSGLVLRREVAA